MAQVKKLRSELLVSFDGAERRLDGAIALKFKVSNPYFSPASLGVAEFNNPALLEWMPMSLMPDQVEDLDNFPVAGKPRIVTVLWDAATDLRIMQSFPAVPVRVSFFDRASAGGVESAEVVVSADVDFTLEGIGRGVKVLRPTAYDPYLDFVFLSPVTVRSARVNFVLELDRVASFDSPERMIFDTRFNTEGWFVGKTAFPEGGIDGLVEKQIRFSLPEVAGLGLGDWFYRVKPIVDQFRVVMNTPTDGQVFQGTEITVSGSVVYYD